MQVRVNLFARFKDLAGRDHLLVALSDNATVGDLRQTLMQTFYSAASLLERSVFAVDNEIAHDATAIPAGVELALLPPVSGG